MPGFTAPKLLWVRKHEPAVFARVRKVLLPKAYIRYRLTGEMIEEMSDASGTLWLDVGARDWSDAALSATGLTRDAMPRLVEGNARAGTLRPELAARWSMTRPPILAGGAGDNAAGAIGLSAIKPGDAFVSLGTSGVLFADHRPFRPYPQAAVHAFCHALPGTWHQMGVTLSAAASLAWWAGITGRPEAELLAEIEMPRSPSPALFLPYLGGERTPHNDGDNPRRLCRAVPRHRPTPSHTSGAGGRRLLVARLPRCARSFGDARRGGRRDRRRLALPRGTGIIAAALNVPLHRSTVGEHGGAFGAARLARMAVTGEVPELVCTRPPGGEIILPDPAMAEAYASRIAQYRALNTGIADVVRET